MRKIAIANRKGGVGKTTTAVHLATSLAARGARVLLVDCDAQGHCSRLLCEDPELGLADLMGKADPELCIHEARPGLYLLAGGRELAGVAREISRRNVRPEMALTEALEPLDIFDFVILDTAPSITELSINALFFSEELLVPVIMELLALDGMAALQEELKLIQRYHDLAVRRILPTFVDWRVSKTGVILEGLQRTFSEDLLSGIRYSTRLSELPRWRRLIWEIDRQNQASTDYLQLCEVIHG
ncbi:Chromosome partitioning protein ParA [subsurface metagenome]